MSACSSRMLLFAVGLAALVVAGGCRSGPMPIGDERLERLVVTDRDPTEGRFRRYEVDGDGTFRVGSGARARLGETDPAPSLDDADLDRLDAAVRRAGWLDAESPVSAGDGPRRLQVEMTVEGAVRRLEVSAHGRRFDPGAAAVVAELDAFARRRFSGVLDALPKGR